MDFDIAGLLANPDVLYMMAGLGGAIGKDNPFAVAAGNMTQQGIAAHNQKKLLMALLGQGGAPKAGETVGSGFDKIANQFIGAHDLTKVSNDGKTATFTGPPSAFESLAGGSNSKIPNTTTTLPSESDAAVNQRSNDLIFQAMSGSKNLSPPATPTPPSGGQQSIINPSVGLPGDLSGLSLAGLKPEDINRAITLGLTGADLERKKVSDLYQNQYWQEMVREKALARGAKDILAPIEMPGIGQMSLQQFNALPPKTKAYAYAMTLRKQNGQSIISPEQFEREINPSEMEKLIELAKRPGALNTIKEIYSAKAPQINLGALGDRQEQHEIIKNWADIGTPKHRASLIPTKEERRSIEKQVEAKAVGKSNDEYEKMLNNALEEHKLRRYEQDVIGAKGRKVSGPKWDPKRNVYVWKFINPRGVEEEKTLEK